MPQPQNAAVYECTLNIKFTTKVSGSRVPKPLFASTSGEKVANLYTFSENCSRHRACCVPSISLCVYTSVPSFAALLKRVFKPTTSQQFCSDFSQAKGRPPWWYVTETVAAPATSKMCDLKMPRSVLHQLRAYL